MRTVKALIDDYRSKLTKGAFGAMRGIQGDIALALRTRGAVYEAPASEDGTILIWTLENGRPRFQTAKPAQSIPVDELEPASATA